MHRRQFLASAGSLAAGALVAGCTSANGEGTRTDQSTTRTTRTVTESTTRTTTTSSDPVGDVWVDRSFTYLYAGSHASAYTVTGNGPIFVFALVADDHHPELTLGGESHVTATELPGNTHADAVFYDRDTDERRVVAYSLSGPVDAASGSVGDVELDESQLAFLRDPAAFSVTDVSAPDSVQQGSRASITVTVENSGGATGTFRAAVTSESLSAFSPGSVDVPSGAQEHLELRVPIYGEDEERVNYTWGSDGGDRTVAVES